MNKFVKPARRGSHSSIARFSLGCVCALAIAGAAAAQTVSQAAPDARAKHAYLEPGVDWSKYKSIQLAPLDIPPDTRDGATPGYDRQFGNAHVLGENDVAALQAAYQEVMREVLEDAGFTVVDEPGPGTLVVTAKVTDIKLAEPLDSPGTYGGYSDTYGGMQNILTRGDGAMAIAAEFADGSTNVPLANAADSQIPLSFWQTHNRITNVVDARAAFRVWAENLRKKLTQK
jgi:Protein of unknown function (DUF3313)